MDLPHPHSFHPGHHVSTPNSSSTSGSSTSRKTPHKCPPTRSAKSVHFKPLVKCRIIECRSQILETGSFESIWYSLEEIDHMKAQLKEALKAIENIASDTPSGDEDDFCIRGLETRTQHGISMKKARRRESIEAVLTVQNLCHDAGLSCGDLIALAYYKYSLHSHNAAYELALEDEKYVQLHVRQ